MPKSNVDQIIQTRIEAFVGQISGLIRESAMDAVRTALGGNGSVPARRAGRKPGRPAKVGRPAGKRSKRVRRSSEAVQELAGSIQAAVAGEPGRRLGEIAKELGEDVKAVRRPAQVLVAEGKLRTMGQRGGTRYYPGKGRSRKA